MPQEQLNIIQRVCLDINFNGNEVDAIFLQNRLSCPFNAWLLNSLERGLEGSENNRIICIDHIELDCRDLLLYDLEKKLPFIIESELRRIVTDYIIQSEDSPAIRSESIYKSFEQKIDEAFIFFLETGSLPWSFQLKNGQTFESVLIDSWKEICSQPGIDQMNSEIIRILSSANSLKRLFIQFSGIFLTLLTERLSGSDYEIIQRIMTLAGKTKMDNNLLDFLNKKLAEITLQNLISGKHVTVGYLLKTLLISKEMFYGFKSGLEAFISKASANFELEDEHSFEQEPSERISYELNTERKGKVAQGGSCKEVKPTNQPISIQSDSEKRFSYYIGNAGLVILHPFLPIFFESTGVLRKERIINPDKAVGLLQILSTGNSMLHEYELVLPKIICGLAPDYPIDTNWLVSESESKEVISLLESVIRHWTALKDTSPEGLRDSFLMRPGKLEYEYENDFLLRVEQKSFDILLDTLPWSYSIIKLPWMNNMIKVDWL